MRMGVFFAIVLLQLTSCTKAVKTPPPPNDAPYHAETRTLPQAPFTALTIRGPIHTTLHTDYRNASITLTGDPRDLAYVIIKRNHRGLVLYYAAGAPKYGPISADIKTQTLNYLNYHGAGRLLAPNMNTKSLHAVINNTQETRLSGHIGLLSLKAMGTGKVFINGINSPHLVLTLGDKAKVQLTGVANISDINIEGDAWLSMYWVKSKKLILRARDNAFIQLAGVAHLLDACINDHAQFNGRYLRATRGFVRANQESIAKVNITTAQHTLATGEADIYYYNKPVYEADFMRQNGAVLDMREWVLDYYPPVLARHHR